MQKWLDKTMGEIDCVLEKGNKNNEGALAYIT
jgi:hypothetical protein